MSIESILVSICSLLDDPNLENALNLEVAKLYKNDRDEYNKKVKEYVAYYAKWSFLCGTLFML